MKKILALMMCIFVIACPAYAFADTNQEGTTNVEKSPSMEYVVYGDIDEAKDAQNNAETMATGGKFKPSIYFSRTSPTSKNVNMYFKISECADYSNAIKYKNIEICHSNLLNNTIYHTFGDGITVTKNYTAMKNGSVLIGSFALPTSVKQVRVDWDFVYVYMVEYGWSTSAWDPIGLFLIQ